MSVPKGRDHGQELQASQVTADDLRLLLEFGRQLNCWVYKPFSAPILYTSADGGKHWKAEPDAQV